MLRETLIHSEIYIEDCLKAKLHFLIKAILTTNYMESGIVIQRLKAN